jgi:hypothetical protein
MNQPALHNPAELLDQLDEMGGRPARLETRS